MTEVGGLLENVSRRSRGARGIRSTFATSGSSATRRTRRRTGARRYSVRSTGRWRNCHAADRRGGHRDPRRRERKTGPGRIRVNRRSDPSARAISVASSTMRKERPFAASHETIHQVRGADSTRTERERGTANMVRRCPSHPLCCGVPDLLTRVGPRHDRATCSSSFSP